jgi:hypothetical protein
MDKVAAVLGLVILIVDGLQELNQYQTNWTATGRPAKL